MTAHPEPLLVASGLRNPPPGCRFHPRCPAAMAVCSEQVPPEVTFDDGVRVACHLFPPGSADGSDSRVVGCAGRVVCPG